MMAFSRGLLQSRKCEIKERVCWSFANIRDNGSQFSLVISFFSVVVARAIQIEDRKK